MGAKSKIEWTDATWNPTVGCDKISAGCDNCYAETIAERFHGVPGRFFNGFELTVHEDRFNLPLIWTRPRRIFVNSMSDLFHKGIPTATQDRIFDVMEKATHHTFQVLTKRSSLMRDYVNGHYDNRSGPSAAPPHIWLGVSVENAAAKVRIQHLQQTRAAVRFLSLEPLLGSLGHLDLNGIHWVIAGGESGPHARPMHLHWVREVRDQCLAQGVPFFFKQWGEWGPYQVVPGGDLGGLVRAGKVRIIHPTGQTDLEVFEDTGGRNTIKGSMYMIRDGKRRTGRKLDGLEWDQLPTGK